MNAASSNSVVFAIFLQQRSDKEQHCPYRDLTKGNLLPQMKYKDRNAAVCRVFRRSGLLVVIFAEVMHKEVHSNKMKATAGM